jgi:hypothetical protein
VVFTERSREVDQRGFGLVDEDERADAQPGQPRAELGAERSAGSGDENGCAREVVAELAVTDVDDRAAEQTLDGGVCGTRPTVPCPAFRSGARARLSVRMTPDAGYVTSSCGTCQAAAGAHANASAARS